VGAAIVGIGTNVDWAAADFTPDLEASMSSLREVSGGRPVDRDALLDGWLARLEPRYEALRGGQFDAGGWSTRQRTTGRRVEVDLGGSCVSGLATGVDPESGALLIQPPGTGGPLSISAGEVVRCRIVE
jgi:biotin-(acetyl-CoA carboxylase) ligase